MLFFAGSSFLIRHFIKNYVTGKWIGHFGVTDTLSLSVHVLLKTCYVICVFQIVRRVNTIINGILDGCCTNEYTSQNTCQKGPTSKDVKR